MSSAEPAPVRELGSTFLGEIREQPDAILRLLEGQADFARARGLDPDAPRGLSKVTLAR